MNIKRRLSRLEVQTQAPVRRSARCEVCRDWPDLRMATVDGIGQLISEDRPERCPSCGFESDRQGLVRSITIIVPDGDHWQGASA